MSWLDKAWQASELGTVANDRGHRGSGDASAEAEAAKGVAPSPDKPVPVPGAEERGHTNQRPGTPQTQQTSGSQRSVPEVPVVPGRNGKVVRLYDHTAPLHVPQPTADPLNLRAAEIGIAYGLPSTIARAFVVIRDSEPAPATAHLWPTLTAHILKNLSAHFGDQGEGQ